MEQIVRRKRVNEIGEWEYECDSCKLWLPKSKFTGCVDWIDAYGNCLMCRSCIAKKAMKTKKNNDRNSINEILIGMGYDPYNKEKPVWKQVEERNKKRYG